MLERDDLSADGEDVPVIILVVGVNGVGKTTTIGKMAALYKSKGKKVLAAAADTFRAAAIEQLQVWGQRAGADVIKHSEGPTPVRCVTLWVRSRQGRRTCYHYRREAAIKEPYGVT